jgi:hypothetical protein
MHAHFPQIDLVNAAVDPAYPRIQQDTAFNPCVTAEPAEQGLMWLAPSAAAAAEHKQHAEQRVQDLQQIACFFS